MLSLVSDRSFGYLVKDQSLNVDAKLIKSYLIYINTLIELTAAEYIHTMINNSR